MDSIAELRQQDGGDFSRQCATDRFDIALLDKVPIIVVARKLFKIRRPQPASPPLAGRRRPVYQGRMRRTRTGALPVGCAAVLAMLLALVGGLSAQAQSCQRADFEAVVDESASALRELNQTNKPAFQDKLRLLKERHGWSHDEFLKQAAPYVQDDRISEFDARSSELLARIMAMGQEGAVAKTPDCAMLAELRQLMKALIGVQQEKWAYMFTKLETALVR